MSVADLMQFAAPRGLAVQLRQWRVAGRWRADCKVVQADKKVMAHFSTDGVGSQDYLHQVAHYALEHLKAQENPNTGWPVGRG